MLKLLTKLITSTKELRSRKAARVAVHAVSNKSGFGLFFQLEVWKLNMEVKFNFQALMEHSDESTKNSTCTKLEAARYKQVKIC